MGSPLRAPNEYAPSKSPFRNPWPGARRYPAKGSRSSRHPSKVPTRSEAKPIFSRSASSKQPLRPSRPAHGGKCWSAGAIATQSCRLSSQTDLTGRIACGSSNSPMGKPVTLRVFRALHVNRRAAVWAEELVKVSSRICWAGELSRISDDLNLTMRVVSGFAERRP